jgi:hypothetical protein
LAITYIVAAVGVLEAVATSPIWAELFPSLVPIDTYTAPFEEETPDGGNTPTDNGNYSPDRKLPRDDHGNPKTDSEATGPHTQLGTKKGRKGDYPQGREFDENGNPVKDIDFTDHGRPTEHTNPHEHRYIPNETGGTPKRGSSEPLKNNL